VLPLPTPNSHQSRGGDETRDDKDLTDLQDPAMQLKTRTLTGFTRSRHSEL